MSQKIIRKFFYGYVIVIATFFSLMWIWGTWNTFGVFFESWIGEFGWTRALTSGANSLNSILFGLAGILVARLTESFGPRKIATVCGFFLGLGYLLMSQISATWQLYLLFGVIIAIGMSAYISMLSIVAKWFEKRRGLMTGIVFSGMGLGMMIMPPVANWLISVYEWRASCIIMGASTLVVTILAAQFLRHAPVQTGQLSNNKDKEKQKTVVKEHGTLSLKEAFYNGQFWQISALYFFMLFCLVAITVHIVIYSTGLGISANNAVNILALIGGVSIVGMSVMGGTADKIGNKRSIAISFALMAIILFWLIVSKELWMLYMFAVFFGFGYGGIQALLSPITAELFGLKSHGIILGTAAFAGTIGAAVGPIAAGYIFDTTASYNLAFLICAIIAVLGFILTLLLPPAKRLVKD